MKKIKLNSKGFSLVELVIVMAIMAVMIGMLAPQYVKFVKESKISADIANADRISTAINVAISDADIDMNSVGITSGVSISAGTSVSYLNGFTAIPESNVNDTYEWVIDWTESDGVTKITLGGIEIYPNTTNYENPSNHS